nr:MAG TPA: hypothetical protein [Caudoviricetes sp.]
MVRPIRYSFKRQFFYFPRQMFRLSTLKQIVKLR